MKKVIVFFIFAASYLLLTTKVHAQTLTQGVATQSGTTNVTVTVSGNSLSVSGFIAPFASIALTINGNIITSTAADANGNFSFTNIAVPKATITVCFDAVDFKKLGESLACITVAPSNGVITKTGVFLPPTLGIQRTEVFVGESALVFGYGMPGSIITVHMNGINGCTVTADATGYYQCNITIQKAGDYQLYADAALQGKPSEAQLKKVLLKGLVSAKVAQVTPVPPSFPGLFAIPWWVWVLLALIALILLIILLRKYRPDLVPGINIPAVKFESIYDYLFRERKLHHWWMKGVGY